MHLAFWKKKSPRETLLHILERAPLFGALFAIAYQVVCVFGTMVFGMSILTGAGYRLVFWPMILLLRSAPFTSDAFASMSLAICDDLPRTSDIAQRTPVFICNMAFAIILNLVVTMVLFALVGLLISLVIAVVKKRRGFRV
jgi:hypothetical protein